MKILHAAGLVTPTRIKTWTFYRRDEIGIARAREALTHALS
jgi:ArsR family transcriptional regulator